MPVLQLQMDRRERVCAGRYDETFLNHAYTALVDLQQQSSENQLVVDDVMRTLIAGLYHFRTNSSDQEWQSCVERCLQHPLKELLHEDPFTCRAFEKPRGYAGDAALMDYIYGREEGWQAPAGTSPLGRMIFEYTTMAPASAGSCARRGHVAELIDQLATQIRQPHLLSIACGHLREASLSAAVKRKKIGRFLGLDSDTTSLEELQNCYASYGVEVVPASIRHLLTGRLDLGQFDLVYSTGLFDYLQQNIARRLAENMFKMVKPGGRMLVANVLPNIPDVGYMESYMDWKLVPRTRTEMIDITATIPETAIRDIHVYAEENVNIIFLELTKK